MKIRVVTVLCFFLSAVLPVANSHAQFFRIQPRRNSEMNREFKKAMEEWKQQVEQREAEEFKKTLAEIKEKRALIREIVIDDITTTKTNKIGDVVWASQGREIQKLPEMFFAQSKMVAGEESGWIEGRACDGKTIWILKIASPEAMKTLEKQFRDAKKDEASIQNLLKANRIKYASVDVEKLRKAGTYEKYCLSPHVNPDIEFPSESWKLYDESNSEWVFETRGLDGMNPYPVMLTFRKKDGLCIKREYEEGPLHVTVMINKVTVNPPKPVAETVFKFQPPAGVAVEDKTEEFSQ